ncbi:hypothetical protein CAEBREN_01103 [Caenorhabditis brenneri]|uniref:DNA2/NAM7 helicase-like C-terminal domain-containing protein n=1 Tax=Caenorhabditis brenneri TaxID=135651 RepID=G0MN27_CAEBE|nr:hypothetical protein CAEBREN_01103 [Caenorhabditis brenneri]
MYWNNNNHQMMQQGTSNSQPKQDVFADWNRDIYTQPPRFIQQSSNPYNSKCHSQNHSQNNYGYVMENLNRRPVTARGFVGVGPVQPDNYEPKPDMLPIKFVPVEPKVIKQKPPSPVKPELSKSRRKKDRQKRSKAKKLAEQEKVLDPAKVFVAHEDFWGSDTPAEPSTSTEEPQKSDDSWADVERVSTDSPDSPNFEDTKEAVSSPEASHENWTSPEKSTESEDQFVANTSIDSDVVRTYHALVTYPPYNPQPEEPEQEYRVLEPRGTFPGAVFPILPKKVPDPKEVEAPEPKEPESKLVESFGNLHIQDTPSTSNPPKAQIEPQPIYLPPRKEQPEPKRGPWYPWTTPEPIRYNLLPPAGPGSLWDLEGCVARDNRKPVVARKQKPVDPVLFAKLRHQEEQRNVFTPYYGEKKDGFKCQKCPKNYRFSDCISFAAMSHTWTSNWDKDLPVLPRANGLVIPLPDGYPDEDTVFAYYRVLVEKENKYILIACHVNLHGYHRGDLRFLEVNTRTELEGFPGTNVIGNLFPGDIVAVTELARNSEARFMKLGEKVSEVSQESTCYWMVSRMQLFPRYQTRPVTFTFLKNRMAVVKGDDEPMRVTVEEWKNVASDKIFIGVCFKPEKLEYNFTEDYGKNKKNMVTSKVARISSYPNAFGTIYGYKECTDQNEHFDVGINAFSNPELTMEQRNKVVETCSLMGFSAANTIFNGRFDCRAFHMMDISKSNLTIKFRIDNPPAQPSLGLWNSGNRIVIGGPEGDVNASIETVIQETEDSLRITARLSRDIPKYLDFRHGEYIVSQREITDHYFLYDGYFQDLEQGSNGRRIIETLYGGPPLELITDPRGFHQQYYFPSVPEMLALNQYQNEYVQMLLDGNPLIIGSSPFGCGKSMTIITAALEIYKRNCAIDELVNQRQQLLITQSNYASVNLIEIAKRICSSGDMSLTNLKFVRFVTEKNWNELPDNCRTEYDMPYIMNRIFCEWGSGRIDENDRRLKRLQKCHFNHMLAYILKNHLLEPHELGGGGRKTYDRLGEFKTPFSLIITEAFFLLYQPDLIMTTADSSKNLLGVLKEVCTVQIDEASQLPEYTLLGLLKTFNRANFGLIGDIHQLPPYCEETLSGKLKEFGIGNTMQRAITGKLFPTSTLRYVYRCHPKTTRMLSQLFYGGNLLSGVQENQRNQFMLRRSDFWVNPDFPFMIVNNDGASYKMGTSVGNDSEKEFIGKMITNLLHHPKYPIKPRDIGVISFYAAQTSVLTELLRGTGVKCGTVDAFQGTEREIIIVCCTNEYVSEFMQLPNRLNVAMSRAKQATIIIGNVEGMRKADYWRDILQMVVENRNLVDVKSWKAPPTHVPHNVTAAQTARIYPNMKSKRSKIIVTPPVPFQKKNELVDTVPNPYFQAFQRWN